MQVYLKTQVRKNASTETARVENESTEVRKCDVGQPVSGVISTTVRYRRDRITVLFIDSLLLLLFFIFAFICL